VATSGSSLVSLFTPFATSYSRSISVQYKLRFFQRVFITHSIDFRPFSGFSKVTSSLLFRLSLKSIRRLPRFDTKNSNMPESSHKRHHHGGHSHSHGHKDHKQSHGRREDENKTSEYRYEWFWTCCNCYANGAMSTFIDQCPGCTHTRCAYCPMESVKIRVGR
jgi:hypothetical protein